MCFFVGQPLSFVAGLSPYGIRVNVIATGFIESKTPWCYQRGNGALPLPSDYSICLEIIPLLDAAVIQGIVMQYRGNPTHRVNTGLFSALAKSL